MSPDDVEQMFLGEANDLLVEMETALLRLEFNPDDEEMINTIFRAAHTIKGTGGVFGFSHVESFTHVVESVLDKLRCGGVVINSDLIALLLSCRDQIGIIVEHAVAKEEMNDDINVKNTRLLKNLNGYLDLEKDRFIVDDKSELIDAENMTSKVKHDVAENELWHILVQFSQDVLRAGMDPLSFLRYLTKVGEVERTTTICDQCIDLESMDPESCYISLGILLRSDSSKKEIEDVFEFVKDDCILRILPPQSSISDFVNLIREMPEQDNFIGEILLKVGALTQKELTEALDIQQQTSIFSENTSSDNKGPIIGEVLTNNGLAHKEVVEEAAKKQKKTRNKKTASTCMLRVDAEKLDQLVNLVGEMVIAGAGTNLIAEKIGDDRLLESMSVMSHLVDDIRDSALRLRMVQIGETFNRFQRVVRDVSQDLGKEIQLIVHGEETELDKTVVEKIGDPLMHLVRNAMDHGIESATIREANKKSACGTLELNAYHDSGSIVIEVVDDGAGLDRDAIFRKAIEKGLIKESDSLSDNDVYRLIFEPGFSTAEKVTNLSGRGVGMDVVRKNIEALRGSVDVESKKGEGSKVIIRLPLTLAIIDGFLVSVGASSYVLPLDMIFECIELTIEEREQTRKQNYLDLRGEVIPLLRLSDHFNLSASDDVRENVVVVQFANLKAGIIVDELLGEFQTVIKPLGKIFEGIKGVSGSTILGNGEVVVILDIPVLIQQVINTGYQGKSNLKLENATGVVH